MRTSRQSLDGAPDDGRPVLISAGALGPGRPHADLVVSPQHRILAGGGQLCEHFAGEALVPAKALTGLPGVRRMRGKREIIWVHFACAAHEIVFANGCMAESLLLGPMVLNGLKQGERRELSRIFGRATRRGAPLNGPPARKLLTVRAAREVVEAEPGARNEYCFPMKQKPGRGLQPPGHLTRWSRVAVRGRISPPRHRRPARNRPAF
ncbi:Hint domain-containing protein [Roseovarius spongiae]|uniref:Hint domain-containing protein n=1 Tax=Roseovarius spongiae TaxID=2320272 RepID=UPI003CCC8B02